MKSADSAGKKALLIIAPKNFRDEEYFDTRRVLEASGVSVITASSAGEASGMLGGKARVDIKLSGVKAESYDAVVFIGGSGSQVFFNDSEAHEIAESAFEKGKILAAICIAPVILANAGLLRGRHATCFEGVFASQLRSGGAEYSPEPVVRDENIITANGPAAAEEFALEIVKALAGH